MGKVLGRKYATTTCQEEEKPKLGNDVALAGHRFVSVKCWRSVGGGLGGKKRKKKETDAFFSTDSEEANSHTSYSKASAKNVTQGQTTPMYICHVA